MTRSALLKEIEELSTQERLELAYGLLDSVLNQVSAPALTQAQRDELRRRLDEHRANPNASRVTLDELRRKLVRP